MGRAKILPFLDMFTQTRLGILAKKMSQLNEGMIFKIVFGERIITEEIIELNTQEQLFKKGINSYGISLSAIGGNYSPYTLLLHPEKVADRITLNDTGEFYESWRVTVNQSGITIDADPIKTDEKGTTNLFQEWGVDVLGLTDESLEKLKIKVIPLYHEYILRTILQS